MRRLLLLCALGLVAGAACAKSTVDDDAGVTDDGGTTPTIDGAACPQYDLTKDPKHCGGCNTACSTGQVCSNGACKAECDPPTTKCIGDAGGCFDLQGDIQHCGNCNTRCFAGDAGGLTPGTNNPDPGLFDGGYDGGVGWQIGTPTCAKGMCGVGCGMGFTACSDGVCYDTQNHHDHCGDCSTSCAMNEWCTQGKCCSTGQMACNGMCVDVTSDDNNCGGCGKQCTNGLHCSGGVCSACGGYAALNSCWYMSQLSQSCNTVCQAHGGIDTKNGPHMGNPICKHFYPAKANGNNWVTVECCSTDNNTNWGSTGAAIDGTFSHQACYLACPCMK